MKKKDDKFLKSEIAMWDTLKSLSDIKDCVDKKEIRKGDLKRLQEQIMEEASWMRSITEG